MQQQGLRRESESEIFILPFHVEPLREVCLYLVTGVALETLGWLEYDRPVVLESELAGCFGFDPDWSGFILSVAISWLKIRYTGVYLEIVPEVNAST